MHTKRKTAVTLRRAARRRRDVTGGRRRGASPWDVGGKARCTNVYTLTHACAKKTMRVSRNIGRDKDVAVDRSSTTPEEDRRVETMSNRGSCPLNAPGSWPADYLEPFKSEGRAGKRERESCRIFPRRFGEIFCLPGGNFLPKTGFLLFFSVYKVGDPPRILTFHKRTEKPQVHECNKRTEDSNSSTYVERRMLTVL